MIPQPGFPDIPDLPVFIILLSDIQNLFFLAAFQKRLSVCLSVCLLRFMQRCSKSLPFPCFYFLLQLKRNISSPLSFLLYSLVCSFVSSAVVNLPCMKITIVDIYICIQTWLLSGLCIISISGQIYKICGRVL